MRCCSISFVTDEAFRPLGVMDPFGHILQGELLFPLHGHESKSNMTGATYKPRPRLRQFEHGNSRSHLAHQLSQRREGVARP